MLIASKLPQQYWTQVMDTVCYIINRAMLRLLMEKTPYELMKGRSPNLSHLRMFGCSCFIHNNGKDSLGKFDAKADEGTFIGYSSRSKAYKVLNHRTGKVEESIHVKFNESTNVLSQDAQEEEKFEMPTRPQTRSMTHLEEDDESEQSEDEVDPSTLNHNATPFVPQNPKV